MAVTHNGRMRLGVLDIGSNTVHLLLVDAHPGAQPVPFASHKRALSLIQHLDERGAISERGRSELAECVMEAVEFAGENGAEDLLAFCTSALRDAPNGAKVIAHVEQLSGLQLSELTGAQEAAMTFLAVRRWYGWNAGTILNLDIGGGSFEMAQGDDELPAVAASVPLGAQRLTRDWLPDDPPSARSVKELREYINHSLEPDVARIRATGRPTLVAGTSKTFRSLARIAGAAPKAAGPRIRHELLASDVGLWAQRLSAMRAEDRLHLPGVGETRARQMLAGALVAEAAMQQFDVERMVICPWALREGLTVRRLDQLVFAGPLEPPRYVSAGLTQAALPSAMPGAEVLHAPAQPRHDSKT